jgi:Bacterial Ig domain
MRRARWLIGWLLLIASPLWAGSVRLAWDASSGADGYALHYGPAAGSYTDRVETGPATTAALSGLPVGQMYYFAATASNAAGESDFSNEVRAVVPPDPPGDVTPPTVAITSPADGGVVPRGQVVTIRAAAADDVGVVRVTFSANAQPLCADTTAAYTCAWDVPNPPRRVYTLQATAADAAGHQTHSAPVTVTSSPPR